MLNVSLTYLRGLEVAELKEEDMPMILGKNILNLVPIKLIFFPYRN